MKVLQGSQEESAPSPTALNVTAPISSPVCAVEAAAPVALSGVAHSPLWLSHQSPEHTSTGLDPAICHGPQHDRCSLSVSALQLSSTPCLCPGKTPFQVEKRTLWGNIFIFPIFCRSQVSRWPSPTFSPQRAHLPVCIHPETLLPSRQPSGSLHSLLQGHGLTQTTSKNTELVLSSQAWCPWMP